MNGLRVYWLDPNTPDGPFPDPSLALHEPNGLLAMGGDLAPQRLRRAYAQGIFPWSNPDESILWWSPHPRTVFVTDHLHVSRRLKRTLAKADYAVTLDKDFYGVIEACAGLRAAHPGTWLGPEMRAAYARLHAEGDAHSIEVWRHGTLIGGLYGVALGRLFFGESMFSRADNASKVGFATPTRQLQAWGFVLIDCQMPNNHLHSLGARAIPRSEFAAFLRNHLDQPSTGPWVS